MDSKAEETCMNQMVSKQDVVLWIVAFGRYRVPVVLGCEGGNAPQL